MYARCLLTFLLFCSISLLFIGLQIPAAFADLRCTIKTERSDCSPVPIISNATLNLADSQFQLHAQYEACFSIRTVFVKGRVLQTISTDKAREYELLGEIFEPAIDFTSFPRTIAYMVLGTSSNNGSFTDVWSAQWLPRHSRPSLLTVPVTCWEYKKEN